MAVSQPVSRRERLRFMREVNSPPWCDPVNSCLLFSFSAALCRPEVLGPPGPVQDLISRGDRLHLLINKDHLNRLHKKYSRGLFVLWVDSKFLVDGATPSAGKRPCSGRPSVDTTCSCPGHGLSLGGGVGRILPWLRILPSYSFSPGML